MGFYKLIYNIFSYPFGWLIFLFYTIFQKNYLAAVIVLAVLVKLVLLPTSINQQKSQAKTKRMPSTPTRRNSSRPSRTSTRRKASVPCPPAAAPFSSRCPSSWVFTVPSTCR